jgi:hypothetical protein
MSGIDAYTDAEIAALTAICDWFMPAGNGFPSASSADPDRSMLSLALEQVARDHSRLQRLLLAAPSDALINYLVNLHHDHPTDFEVLRLVAVGRYLMCRSVWQLLGYPGHRPAPVQPGEAEKYLADELLAPVLARGPIYIPTPPHDS